MCKQNIYKEKKYQWCKKLHLFAILPNIEKISIFNFRSDCPNSQKTGRTFYSEYDSLNHICDTRYELVY